MTPAEFAARVDHTILRPEATRAEVEAVAVEAVELGCASVCVQPSMVHFVRGVVGDRLPVCSVVGFPHGASPARITAGEAAAVVAWGASEVDLVADLGALADDDLPAVAAGVAEVRVPDAQGQPSRARVLGPGDSFGEEALIAEAKRNATA